MALKAGYKGIKKYIADKLNALGDLGELATDAEIAAAISTVESVIGPVEDGEKASQAYEIGEHFIRDGKFCTVIQTIAAEATLTKNTNYVEGDISALLSTKNGTLTPASGITFENYTFYRVNEFMSTLNIAVNGVNLTSGSATTLGTVPTADLPPNVIYGVALDIANNKFLELFVNTAGLVKVTSFENLTGCNIRASITWLK